MIVYTGKNFWNDFNNGDEGLFQDANWPRDDDKFKLRPWLQSDKRDWRWSNKNTDFSHILIKGRSAVEGTPNGYSLKWKVPKLQESWTSSELAPVAAYGMYPELMQMERQNNPFVTVKTWDIQYKTWDWQGTTKIVTENTSYFEIAQSGLYYVMMYGVFYFDPSYYDSSNSYLYKYWVWVAQPLTSYDWVFENTDRTQARVCGNGDILRFMQISRFNKWNKILPVVAHSFTRGTNYVMWAMSVVRLW
jgi:hypothetical protein